MNSISQEFNIDLTGTQMNSDQSAQIVNIVTQMGLKSHDIKSLFA